MSACREARRVLGVALEDHVVAVADRLAPERHARLSVLHGDEREFVLHADRRNHFELRFKISQSLR